jgi:uncharacterized protein (TIGR03086 family)
VDADTYERALQRTGKIVAGTTRDQLDGSTPCPDWTVGDLLNHIIGGCLAVSSGAAGEARPIDDGVDHAAGGHVAAFEDAARGAIEAFQVPGALESKFEMSWGDTPGTVALGLAVTDAVVHGWDLATATGQDAPIDEDIAEEIYGMTSSMMEPKGSYPRGDAFDDPVEVPDDAPASARMLAYLGRQP